jgi:CRP-like cAMP-binding protein
MDFVGKGEFLCLPPATDPSQHVAAIVHEGPVVLALMPRSLVATATGELPARNVPRLLSWTWRRPTALACAKTALLLLPTEQRLILELVRLARRFGRRQDDRWTIVPVRLRQDDLASLIVRSRSNVSRAFARLQRKKFVDRAGRHILIATAVLDSGGLTHGLDAAASRPASENGYGLTAPGRPGCRSSRQPTRRSSHASQIHPSH